MNLRASITKVGQCARAIRDEMQDEYRLKVLISRVGKGYALYIPIPYWQGQGFCAFLDQPPCKRDMRLGNSIVVESAAVFGKTGIVRVKAFEWFFPPKKISPKKLAELLFEIALVGGDWSPECFGNAWPTYLKASA